MIEEEWKKIFGEAMPADVLNRFLKIQKALNIRDDDALWQIIVPLEYYQRLHSHIPLSMRKESDAILSQIKSASAAVLAETIAAASKSKTDAIAEINKERERAKTAFAKALDSTLPDKIGEATAEIKQTIEKQKIGFFEKSMLVLAGMILLLVAIIAAYITGEDCSTNTHIQQQQKRQGG